MNKEKILRVTRRHTHEASIQVMRAAVFLLQRAKRMKIFPRHLKGTLARPPIYHRAYPEKLATENPIGLTIPKILLFVKQDRKSLDESKSLEEIYVSTILGN